MRPLRCLALLAAAFAAPALAQLPPPTIELAEPAVELPMILRGPLPAVEVTVDGRGPYLFLIDTGAAGYARADTALVAELGLPEVGSVVAGDGTGRVAGSFPTVRLAALEVGPLRARDVEAMTRDYNLSPQLPPIHGVLGIELFRGLLLTLDYPRRVVRIERGELPEPDGVSVHAFTRAALPGGGGAPAEAGPPVLVLAVGGREVEVDLDTGAMGGLLLPQALVDELPRRGEPRVVGRGRTVVGEFEISLVELAVPVSLGAHQLAGTHVETAPPFRRGSLGSRRLAGYRLTLDLARGRLRLVPGDAGAPAG